MPLKVIVGSETKDVEDVRVYPLTTAKRVTRVEAWNGSAWKLVQSFAPPISLSVFPTLSLATTSAAAVVAVTTANVTATVVGGTAPYTYAWVQTSGPAASIYSPTSATTKFAMALGPGSGEDAQFTCTVTDSLGQTAAAIAFATFSNTSGA